MTAVDPIRTDEEGWAFREGEADGPDPVNGFRFLREAYVASDSQYRAHVTVPVLWDKQAGRIVSNSDDDILRMFNSAFNGITGNTLDLVPEDHRDEIDTLNELTYRDINNGVYETGFATSQHVYEEACKRLFGALDMIEERLSCRRFLLGSEPLECDWRLFPTLVRFDAVYHGHFKCNIRRLLDYPNLFGYLRDLYQWPGEAETVNFDHIKRHYYFTHDDINPTRIVPLGPALDLAALHGREKV